MKHIPIARILERVPLKDQSNAGIAAALASFPRAASPVRVKESCAGPDLVAQAREEGREEARAEYEALRKEDAERHAAELAATREQWIKAESGRLAAQVEDGLRHIENAITATMARLLKPVLVDHAAKTAIDGLSAVLRQIMMERPGATFRVSGPVDLLDRLRARFEGLTGAEFVASASADIRVEAEEAVIETCLAPWIAKLADDAQ
jgi:hypothetical protein